ncbi:MAG: polysaccharide pyruvyl transferase family protein [Bacteroidota bacterium]
MDCNQIMKKRKNITVGILTLPFNNKYGGILQTYALQTYLKKLGYNAIHIYRDFPEKNKFIQVLKDVVKLLIGKTILKKLKSRYTFYFFKEYVNPKTERIRTSSDFKKLKKYNFSSIVVGSDQVWRKACAYGDLKMNYFMDFADDRINRMSYAASFGVDSWQFDADETEKIKNEIQKFTAVSLREKSGVELVEKHWDIKAEHVVDPVMLLSPGDYIKLLENEQDKKQEGDCLFYLLDFTEEKHRIVNDIAQQFNYKTYSVNKDVVKWGIRSKPSVTSWLAGFYDARFIITDSFHGTMFAILFNKPFLVIGNEKRGLTRFNSLLNDFNLSERMVLNQNNNYMKIVNKEIDWENVQKIIEKKREEAYNFLTANIQ